MITATRALRDRLRKQFFQLFRQAFGTDDGKRAVTGCLSGLLKGTPNTFEGLESIPSPYPDIGRDDGGRMTALRDDLVFITARFRSGSTLLWNLFRHLDDCTAYYEPFNERRWFDPLTRGDRVDSTHRAVREYWHEYDGLEVLGRLYRQEWTERNLYMDEHCWNPGMKRYVEVLIERAPGRPVLQFNRIDFRLPWIRRRFPRAKLVHLYRHPREQWCSTLGSRLRQFPPTGRVSEFTPYDGYYLLTWARDLKYHFPFLDEAEAEHPYQLFYYLWKLSYLFGVRYSHHSVCFESLVSDPETSLGELFRELGIAEDRIESLLPLIVPPERNRWQQYADDGWFRRHENHCETVLREFLTTGGFSPAAIREMDFSSPAVAPHSLADDPRIVLSEPASLESVAASLRGGAAAVMAESPGVTVAPA